MSTGLRERGFPIHRVEAVDFERIIEWSSGGARFLVRVWIDWEEMDRWEVCWPAAVGFFARSDHREHKRLLEALDEFLRRAGGV